MDASSHRFFDGFKPVERKRLLACTVRQDYPDGTYLFREGDEADGVYLVLDGHVEIFRAAGNREKILYAIPPGDYFGEVAVLDGLGRSTSARARGATSVAKVPGDVLLKALAKGPGALTLGLLKHVLASLRRANDQVVGEIVRKEKLSLVGEMASSLMHDLRVPVSSIRLSADLITATSQQGKIPQWCDGVRLQCDRLVSMATELMEFSRGESTLALSRTTTAAFLEQFQMLNEGCLTPPGINVCFVSEPAEIEIDAVRMHRVVQNLVTNAVDALHNTPRPSIEVRAWVKDATFNLAVEDNGPGIPDAIQNEIYEPFVTYGKSKGIGLGMAIVRNIVSAHAGTITFKTAPDRGTSFLIAIPQKLVHADTGKTQGKPAKSSKSRLRKKLSSQA